MSGISNLTFPNGHPMGVVQGGIKLPVSLRLLERGVARLVMGSHRGATHGVVVETQDGGRGNQVKECRFVGSLGDVKDLGVVTSKGTLKDRELVFSPDRRVIAFSLTRLFGDADGVDLNTVNAPLVGKNYAEATLVVHETAKGLRLPTAKELASMNHLERDLWLWTGERRFGICGEGHLNIFSFGPVDCIDTLGVACVGGSQDSE